MNNGTTLRSYITFVTALLLVVCPGLDARAQPGSQARSPAPNRAPAQTTAMGLAPGLGQDLPLPPAPPDVPAPERFTLAQAVEYAQSHSPQIAASHYNVLGARANYVGQRVPANPTIAYGGLNNTVAPTAFGNGENYAVYLPIETSGKLRWRTDQSKNQWLQSQSDARTTQISVRQSVTGAYVALQVANRGLQDERESYDTARQLRDLTLQQFQAGAAPQTNAIRAQVALTQEAGNLFTAINAVKAARSALNIQMGRNADEPVEASEPLEYAPIHPRLEQLQAQALKSRPEIASAEYNRRALKANVGLQRAAGYPDLVLGTALSGSNGVELGFVLPLFDFGSIRGAVQQAQKNEKAQEQQQTQIRQSVELDVDSAYQSLNLAEQTVEAYQSGIVPQSESLLARTEQGYKLGASTILDLIDAQSTLRAARIAYYGAIGNYRQALAQLEHAVGQPVTALNSAPAPPAAAPAK